MRPQTRALIRGPEENASRRSVKELLMRSLTNERAVRVFRGVPFRAKKFINNAAQFHAGAE